ncbi:MAG: hypothetical protein AAB407_02625 [Patescibacteria group bacterium]
MLIHTLLLMTLSVAFLTVLTNLALTNITEVTRSVQSEQAFQIAEAGIEYYRWHLAHSPEDYTNGTGLPGPYAVDYYNREGNKIGQFILTITAPILGSTVTTIRSTGILDDAPGSARTIEAKMGIASFTKFAVVANDTMYFGVGTETFGLIHSNGGIRFDGLAHNLITSAVASYNDPDHSGQDEFGVHTHVSPVDPLPPAQVPERPDVFMAGRQFPVPAIDFDGIIADLAEIKSDAQANGTYFPDSGQSGYDVIVKTNDTFDVYRVNSIVPKPQGCSNVVADNDWDTWSVNTKTFLGNYPFPANGLIFFEDDIWVSGQIDSARITIGAARFPETPGQIKNININNDLRYTNYDGTDVIGLISQNDINVGLYSEDDLRIDGALISKNERIGRLYYRAPTENNTYCGPEALRDTVTLFGMLATNERYGFSWTCGGVYCSGYETRTIIYDNNLLFSPPPGFPLTSDQYEVFSWEEIR